MTLWHIWNRLGLTRTARTAHRLTTAMREALTDDEVHELAVYNDEVYHGVTHPEGKRVRMRALQDRYDASVRSVLR